MTGHKSAAIQEQEILKGTLKHFGMNPELVVTAASSPGQTQSGAEGISSNWYLEVYEKVMAVMPAAYTKVYQSKTSPTEAEWAVLTANEIAEVDAADPEAERRDKALIQHPQGFGWISNTFASNYHTLVAAPMTHTVGFAVPSQEALDVIAALGPIIEVGAGTGYWAALLQHAGADIIAYDEQPPSLSSVGTEIGNRFFCRQYTEVLQADSVELFQQTKKSEHSHRALMMIFPENPAHVAVGAYESWDAHCVEAYHLAGGRTVVYVGDRPEKTLQGGL